MKIAISFAIFVLFSFLLLQASYFWLVAFVCLFVFEPERVSFVCGAIFGSWTTFHCLSHLLFLSWLQVHSKTVFLWGEGVWLIAVVFLFGLRCFSAFFGAFLFSQQSTIFPMDLEAFFLLWSFFYHSLVTTTLSTMFCLGFVWFLFYLVYCYLWCLHFYLWVGSTTTRMAREFMAPVSGPFFWIFFFLTLSMSRCWSGGLAIFSLVLSTWDL